MGNQQAALTYIAKEEKQTRIQDLWAPAVLRHSALVLDVLPHWRACHPA